ncbi:MAG: DNA methyltransferase [Candidatus Thorarchaeota archaeon]
MKTFILYKREHQTEIPEKFKEYDTRGFEEVIKLFIEEYSKAGDTVLDIFAGLGTNLIMAENLGRIPYGIEILEEKYQYIVSKIKNKENIIHGDARKLGEYKFPPIDLVYTSPTFMSKYESRDPFNNFKTRGNYTKYLKDIKRIFSDLKNLLKPKSYIIVDVANLKTNGITTLAWDIGRELSDIFYFEGEIILAYEEPRDKESFGYDHSYTLVFSRKK